MNKRKYKYVYKIYTDNLKFGKKLVAQYDNFKEFKQYFNRYSLNSTFGAIMVRKERLYI